jgi:integrase
MGYELRRDGPLGNWHIFWSEGRRSKRRSTRTRDRDIAEIVLANFILEKDRPAVDAAPEQFGLGSLIDQYWREKGTKGDGAKANKSHMKHVRAFHADDTVASLTEDRQQEYEDRCLEEGAANGTVNRRRGILRSALRHALKRGRITAIPIIPSLEEPESSGRYFTRQQVAALLRGSRSERLHHVALFICLMLATGHRKTAVLELKWDRVDLEAGTVDFRLPGKKHSKKKRTRAALPDKTLRLLRIWRKRSPGPVVISPSGRFMVNFRRHWKRVTKAAGMPGAGTHTLKHTAATWALRVASPWLVEGQMATSAKTLMKVYGRHLSDDLKSVAEMVAHSRPGRSARSVPDVIAKGATKKKPKARKSAKNKGPAIGGRGRCRTSDPCHVKA